MSEAKDPAVKLFGKTILFPEISPRAAPFNHIDTTSAQKGSPCCSSNRVDGDSGLDQDRLSCASSFQEESDVVTRRVEDGESSDKYTEEVKTIESRQGSQRKKESNDPANEAESASPDAASVGENSEAPSTEKGSITSQASNSGEQQNEANTSEEKTLKKPDKIIPCPRCKSMDTKFCYYNNYNVSQPRHFCKNCQRYWTAGGTMRNVPVGAGRRKNKTSSSQYRHMTVPEALQNVRTDIPNGVHPSFKANGTVLTFGSEIPLHESMASVLNIAEKSLRNGTRNGFHTLDPLALPVSSEGGKNGNDHSIRSAAAETGTKDEAGKIVSQDSIMQNLHSFPPQVPCYPSTPWPYPWTSAPWSSPMPPPGFCPPGFAMPIFPPAAYWGCSVPGPWSVPWLAQPPSPKRTAGSSGPNSPTLGKHSRDENILKLGVSGDDEPMKELTTERCLWIPKTLRIDDPEEAAKSSIWTTLGIRNDKSDSIGGRGLFKAYEQKGDERNHTAETPSVLHANPAALSRSVKFHESS